MAGLTRHIILLFGIIISFSLNSQTCVYKLFPGIDLSASPKKIYNAFKADTNYIAYAGFKQYKKGREPVIFRYKPHSTTFSNCDSICMQMQWGNDYFQKKDKRTRMKVISVLAYCRDEQSTDSLYKSLKFSVCSGVDFDKQFVVIEGDKEFHGMGEIFFLTKLWLPNVTISKGPIKFGHYVEVAYSDIEKHSRR